MRAVRLNRFGEPPVVTEVPEPRATRPGDVVIRVAGAGVCRTDLHIVSGGLAGAFTQTLPLTLGHENSGHVLEVAPGVDHLTPGDPVIVHPAVTCGHCAACRQGNDMHCRSWRFPGVDNTPGGYAELLRTSARALVPLPPGTDPAPLAPFADAGLTAMHAVRRLAPHVHPGAVVVCLGSGGVGQVAIQLMRILTPAQIVVVEPNRVRAAAARRLGADTVLSLPAEQAAQAVLDLTHGLGAHAVLDLVGEGDVPAQALRMLAKGGIYSIVGYGGGVRLEHLDMINRELTVLGNQIGTFAELADLMALVTAGRVTLDTDLFPLSEAPEVLAEVAHGQVSGRAVLVPGMARSAHEGAPGGQ